MKRTRFNEAPYIAIWETTRACDLACLHLFVSHTGEIYPSGFLPISAGNVRKDSLIDIYRYSPLFRDLRDTSKLKGKCGDCEFREICSGSRARAYATTGDYLAEEPFCNYVPRRNRQVELGGAEDVPARSTLPGAIATC